MKYLTLLIVCICFCIKKANTQVVIRIEDVTKHIGDSVKICTKIYGGRFQIRFKDSPTYLEVGDDFPNQPLTIVIWKKDRDNFEDRPEMMYAYKDVCITGRLEIDKGKVQMVVTKPAQIILQE